MIFIILLFTNLKAAELPTVKVEGNIVEVDLTKICLQSENSKTCIKRKSEYDDYTKLKNSNQKVTIVINSEDIIQEGQK